MSRIKPFRVGKGQTHLHIVHAHYVPTIIHVLLQIFILQEERTSLTRNDHLRLTCLLPCFHSWT